VRIARVGDAVAVAVGGGRVGELRARVADVGRAVAVLVVRVDADRARRHGGVLTRRNRGGGQAKVATRAREAERHDPAHRRYRTQRDRRCISQRLSRAGRDLD
jgi:hypothetical protein